MAMTDIASLRDRAKLPVKQAGGSTVAEFFEANRGAIAAVLPKHVTPDRLMKTALGAIRSTPALQGCTTESLFGALVQSAALGLEPNTVLGHAYLVPFWNKKKGRQDVQLIIGYRGLIDLARRSGQIVSIAAHVVHERDEFAVELGTDSRIVHRPNMVDDRGAAVAFYAVAQLKDGGVAFEVMSLRDVKAVAAATQSKGESGPWRDHFLEMGRKTVIRRLSKYLPLSIELATAVALDERTEIPAGQGLDRVLDGTFRLSDDGADDGAPVDSSGAEFDAEVHVSGQGGVPVLNADGTFRRRPGRRGPDAVGQVAEAGPSTVQRTNDAGAGGPDDDLDGPAWADHEPEAGGAQLGLE